VRLWGTRKDASEQRRWNRRLVDFETRDFIDEFLDETREVFRRANGEFDLEGLTEDVFGSHPTTDVRWLKDRGVAADEFYERELAPNWECLSQAERAGRIEKFMALSNSLGTVHRDDPQPPDLIVDMVATVHLKVLLLSWAYDRTYSFIDRIVSNPAQFGANGTAAS
jgi:hypothetical protein